MLKYALVVVTYYSNLDQPPHGHPESKLLNFMFCILTIHHLISITLALECLEYEI